MELPSITYAGTYGAVMARESSGNKTSSQSVVDSENQSAGEDRVTLSKEGRDKASHYSSTSKVSGAAASDNDVNLEQQELEQLQQLKHRDTEVRAHEQAHLSSAGRYATSGASFTYQRGPDGASYAIGGEVDIDLGEESTPEATIVKMQTIQRAALAPADPSGADKRIAADANAKEAKARQELLQVQQEALLQGESSDPSQTANQDTRNNTRQQGSSTNRSALNNKFAAYQKMAAY